MAKKIKVKQLTRTLSKMSKAKVLKLIGEITGVIKKRVSAEGKILRVTIQNNHITLDTAD